MSIPQLIHSMAEMLDKLTKIRNMITNGDIDTDLDIERVDKYSDTIKIILNTSSLKKFTEHDYLMYILTTMINGLPIILNHAKEDDRFVNESSDIHHLLTGIKSMNIVERPSLPSPEWDEEEDPEWLDDLEGS